jgi:hypothetical protein
MANSDSIKDLPGLNDVIADDGVMDAGPATPDLRPCAIGGVGQIGMGQC